MNSNLNNKLSQIFAGAAHTVTASISINGEPLASFHKLQLAQSTTTHHKFTLHLDRDMLHPARGWQIDEYTQQYLGQRLSINFHYKDLSDNQSPENYFTGVITSVSFTQEEGYHGHIVLKGYSPTILLDDSAAPHTQSFTNRSLQAIVQEIISQGGNIMKQIPAHIQPRYNSQIPYSCQHNETNYNYLCRLATGYGEWFYYNGTEIFFGKPPEQSERIKLVYGRDVRKIDISTQVKHTGNRKYDYDALSNQTVRVSDNKELSGLDLPGEMALQIAQKVFPTESRTPAFLRSDYQFTIDSEEANYRGGVAAEMFTIEASTTIPLLHPGCVIELNMKDPLGMDSKPVTSFLVTEVLHELERTGKYECTFKGIPSKVLHIPQAQYKEPLATPHLAKVVSNTDPNGTGCVQVQFQWQEQRNDTTHFIRVMTPDAGSSNIINRNRGFVFIPEVGDQVMIGFEYGHPDRPYVMGGMFHGKNGSGGYSDNHLKTIKTRSGHSIELDDSKESWSITIKDDQGNIMRFDTKGKNIEISAPETMTLNCKNMSINVGENMSTNVGQNITESAGENIRVSAGKDITQIATGDIKEKADNMQQIATNNYNRESMSATEIAETISTTTTEGDISFLSAKTVNVNAAEKNKLF